MKTFSFLPFFWNSNDNFLFLFPETGGRSCSALGVATHKLLVHDRLNAFKITGMVYKNIGQRYHLHSLSMQLFNFLELLNTLSHYRYKPFTFARILLTYLQILNKLIFSNRIISIWYSFNRKIQYYIYLKAFRNGLCTFEVKWKLLKIFTQPDNRRPFYGPELNL